MHTEAGMFRISISICVGGWSLCVCVHSLSGRDAARADMLVHRVHSCTVYSIRERAFLISGELRHLTAQGAAGTCDQPPAGCCSVHCRTIVCRKDTH